MTEYQRKIAENQIDEAFANFVKYTDDYSQGAINGTADSLFMLDVISTLEYIFIMHAVIAVLKTLNV